MSNPHEANRETWNQAADWWQEQEDRRGHWRRSHQEPALVLSPTELTLLGDLSSRRACVLGSGDNEVAFALCGLGAAVTSVDISERRLEIAARRAAQLGLTLEFVRADVVDLRELADHSFDVIYTGGHVSIWVADLQRYYAEAVRILRPGGLFLVNEYHPIRRMWHDDDENLRPTHDYFHRGPYTYQSESGLTSYEYHWTAADHIQAMLDAGCALRWAEENGQGEDGMIPAALARLPANLLLVGVKIP